MRGALIFFFLLPLVAFAQLEWKKTTISYDAKAEDESVTALFHFANVGQKTVKIMSTKTSCGCTVAQLEKNEYAPGELGVMKVKFTFGDRTGQQIKQVQVYTDDPTQYTYLLTLEVNIPEFVSVEPQLLFWVRGEEPAAKSSVIEVLAKDPIIIEKVEPENPSDAERFDVELIKLEEGRRYKVSATPKSTETSLQTKLKVLTNIGKDTAEPRSTSIILQVY